MGAIVDAPTGAAAIPTRALVMCATPTYTGEVGSEFAGSMVLSAIHCAKRGVFLEPIFVPGSALVDLARNYLVADFLSRKYATHLFWIDADLAWNPLAIHKMVSRGLDCVCGVYPYKSDKGGYPYVPVGRAENGLQRAERVPGGFMCLSRRAVETITAKCTEWYDVELNAKTLLVPAVFKCWIEGKHYHGEDFTFCSHLNAAGIPIYVETDVNFFHTGKKAWGGNLAVLLAREDKQRETDPEFVANEKRTWEMGQAAIDKLQTEGFSK